MIEYMARQWLLAEARASQNPDSFLDWEDVPTVRREEIRERVRCVLDGEVLKSQCGPGDLEIWHGRFRTAPLKGPAPDPRIGVLREVSYFNRYDSLEVGNPVLNCSMSSYLFGNANIGWWNRTNQQVGGQTMHGECLATKFWYMQTQTYPDMDGVMEYVFSRAVAKFVVGHRYVADSSLIELFRSPRILEEVIIPRQSFEVRVEFHSGALLALNEAVAKWPVSRGTMRIYLHLEGWRYQDKT